MVRRLIAAALKDEAHLGTAVATLTTVCVSAAFGLTVVAAYVRQMLLPELAAELLQTVVITALVTTPVITWVVSVNRRLVVAGHELLRLSRTDTMTGLLNRRAFLQELDRLGSAPVVLALIDIDRFKRVNDQFGHTIGDVVIEAIGQRLKVFFSDHIVARMGGEEFAVLVSGMDFRVFCERLDKLRAEIAGTPVETDSGPVRITISVGVARRNDRAFTRFYAAADAALYQAKATGRNQVLTEADLGRIVPGDIGWQEDLAWVPRPDLDKTTARIDLPLSDDKPLRRLA